MARPCGGWRELTPLNGRFSQMSDGSVSYQALSSPARARAIIVLPSGKTVTKSVMSPDASWLLSIAQKANVKKKRMGKKKAFSRVCDLGPAKNSACGLYSPESAQMALPAAKMARSQTSQSPPLAGQQTKMAIRTLKMANDVLASVVFMTQSYKRITETGR